MGSADRGSGATGPSSEACDLRGQVTSEAKAPTQGSNLSPAAGGPGGGKNNGWGREAPASFGAPCERVHTCASADPGRQGPPKSRSYLSLGWAPAPAMWASGPQGQAGSSARG